MVAAHSIVGEFNYLLSKGPDFAGSWLANALAQGHVSPRDVPALEPRMAKIWAEVVLARYGVGIIDECERLIAMPKKLISGYLQRRMLAGDPKGKEKAKELSEYLADHNHFLSHGRRVSAATAQEKGITVEKPRKCRTQYCLFFMRCASPLPTLARKKLSKATPAMIIAPMCGWPHERNFSAFHPPADAA